jgi:Concanavalin A-like lectin/glucanases superfamily
MAGAIVAYTSMMGTVRVIAMLAIAGCGRLGFDAQSAPTQTPPDSGAVSTPTIDALAAPTSGLIAYWSFDDYAASDAMAIDTVGGNTATCSGACPELATGVVGNGVKFDGAASCMSVPSMAGWNDPMFTVSAWTSGAAMGGPVVVHESDNACPSPEMQVENSALGLIQLNTTDSTHNLAWMTTPIADPSQWHLVAVTWDGTTQSVYVDGQCACSVVPPLKPLLHNAELSIGCYPDQATYFTGAIDEIRIYNRQLAGDELATMYAAVAGGALPASGPCTQTCASAPP